MSSISCEAIKKSAASDFGLVPTDFFEFKSKQDDLLIALVVSPNYDFHWYRRGDDQFWTHKVGGSEATNVDNSGHTISSPETADRGPYSDFCGYFRVKNYPVDLTEQNGGYVQIGNMTAPPVLSTKLQVSLQSTLNHLKTPSSVQLMMYSGRRNPSLPLSQVSHLMNHPVLQKIGSDLILGEEAGANLPLTENSIPKIGEYQGVQILDREGVYFPKGSIVQIKGDSISVQKSFGAPQGPARSVPGMASVENAILSEFGKNQ